MSVGPISNLRMFLSVKESLGCVINLRRCSSIIETATGVVYGHRERERAKRMKCWSHWI
jgi:hypothetical protein